MAIAGVLLLIGIAALAAYIAFGGPRLAPEMLCVIKDVASGETPPIVRGRNGYAHSGPLQLWYEEIPSPEPEVGTVLLLIGMGADSLMWPRAFVDALLAAGYRVIRFDQRGTGMSDWMDAWQRKDAYSLGDLAEDAVAVLDHLDIRRAHVCGLSFGGMVAQELAIQHPDRVDSLVLMSTSPDVTDESLPFMSISYLLGVFWKSVPILRYRIAGGEENLVKERIAKLTIALPGSTLAEIRDLAEHVVYDLRCRRGFHASAVRQHQAAAAVSRPRGKLLESLHVPTLVIHGEVDPMLPIEHGRQLAKLIPGAETLWMSGVGHVFPYPDMPMVMRTIIGHLSRHQSGTSSLSE
jgi:pimeloyl-ACP methyl ester carboxylesterase